MQHGDLVLWEVVDTRSHARKPFDAGGACCTNVRMVPAQMFTAVQRAHLDVLGIWAVLRSQVLTTDDSFLFNKVRAVLKGCAW